jgi:hypothetical protein
MKCFLITSGNLKSTAVLTVSVSELNDPGSSVRTSILDTNKQLIQTFFILVRIPLYNL